MTIEMGFKLVNYKSYGEEGAGFPLIRPINLIIGRNNIGKSALLDALDFLCDVRTNKYSPVAGAVHITEVLGREQIIAIFPEHVSGGELGGNHWRSHGQYLIDSVLTWRCIDEGVQGKAFVNVQSPKPEELTVTRRRVFEAACVNRTPKTHGSIHVRLAADRDIAPEPDDGEKLQLSSSGAGATKIIHQYLHHAPYDRDLIQSRLLVALNSIFYPDIVFNEITTRFLPAQGKWEVFLGEENKGPIPLSASGSGLKTVILTLLNLLLRPVIEGKSLKNYIFSFEELENNLHPALQRNLFAFLEDFAVNEGAYIFLTTHSNVAIDLYSASINAQIVHLRKGLGGVYGVDYSSMMHGHAVLDDLGVRASDLLQSNGLIWVEGPSDRVYLNKWIELWGDGAYKEGRHYQFVFYGGSVLANISVDADGCEDAISAFKVNRNFIFVCDSDRRSRNSRIKPRVAKLISDVVGGTGYVWVTQAREIENYIPASSFQKVHSRTGLPEIGEYQSIQDYLVENRISKAAEYTNKHARAVQYAEYFEKEAFKEFRPELDSVMLEVIERIRKWNT